MQFLDISKRLQEKRVAVAGCGGLGSNAAVALARVGIGELVLADFDIIEQNNLNRQYFFFDQIGLQKAPALKENIARINPDVRVEAHIIRLGPVDILRLFSGCDIIIEAFDTADMKEMIIETVLSELPGTPIISGVGLAGWGRSLSITISDSGNLHVVGDRTTEATENNPPLAPRVGIVANMMANLAMELLLGENA
jgi:sulfur carrier protein ThiS adenylyltransferase